MKNNTIFNYKEELLGFLPEVTGYNEMFKALNRRWSCAITAGMIEAGKMEADAARLFSPLIQDMRHTKEDYGRTQKQLVDAILIEMSQNVVSQIVDAAKFTINILKRNLFERTADVGYLATDSEIVDFIRRSSGASPDPGDRERMRERLVQYRYEYTVYNEILILDIEGRVLANLDPGNGVTHSRDTLLARTHALDPAQDDQYIETYRKTDLYPKKDEVLIYSQRICDPDTGTAIGTLCLCFDFEDEADRIFKDLSLGNSNIISAVLNEQGQVMVSGNPGMLPVGTRIPVDMEADFRLLNLNGKACFVCTVETDGYQGFHGLPWYGMAIIPTQVAFNRKKNGAEFNTEKIRGLQHFSSDLTLLRKRSNDLLGAMKIDSINGEVQAAKFRAKAFVKVLHFVKEIGEDINNLFASAIEDLQQTIAGSLFTEVEFRAFQGNNIADRNLYERANDVCWWALTPLFRALMEKQAQTPLEEAEKEGLKKNLQYINDLYTPYLRLILADTKGCVVAVSDPPDGLEEKLADAGLPKGQDFVGTQVDPELLSRTLNLKSAKEYCVSQFSPSPFYGGRPSYIYSTAVRSPGDTDKAVGVIQIVFDSEPQFQAMLRDVLPRDESNQVVKGSFSLFADRNKTIISCTHPDYAPGTTIPLDDKLFKYAKNERNATIVTMGERSYALGLQVSDGYREYKKGDGYDNDLICMVLVPI